MEALLGCGSGNDGLQYLCSKYSSLITRLREEVLARQEAEAEARLLERRLRDELGAWDTERASWEQERRAWREEILTLRAALQRDADDLRSSVESGQDLRHAAPQ